MSNTLRLTPLQEDALREVMHLGTAHAVNAFGKMTDKKIQISLSNLMVVPVGKVPDEVAKKNNTEEVVVGLFFRILGDLSGKILLIFPSESAERLLRLLLGTFDQNSDDTKVDLERSALMEAGNILANSYLNALASITDLTIFPSIPHYAQDMLGAVIDSILIEISRDSDMAIFMETEFSIEGLSLSGDFLFFPDSDSLRKILEKVGVS